LKFPVIGSSTE